VSVIGGLREALGGSPVAQAAYRGVLTSRLGAERWALAMRVPSGPATGRILAYHSIGTPSWGANDVSPTDFERHLQIAADDGWSFATPADVMAHPERKQLAITFDDGVTSVLTNAVPVLRHHRIPATMFAVTGWADGGRPDGLAEVLDWAGLAKLQDAGVSVASHSANHRDFGRLDADAALRELVDSRERMEAMLDVEVREFAIPFGQSQNWTAAAGRAAAEAGYTTVYAQSVHTRPAGTVPRTFITRIDKPKIFRAALAGAYDGWEEWFLGPRADPATTSPG
jgi:peptidoglycan/xylan/chitin deacetylase (PgdA/CDA1 family)